MSTRAPLWYVSQEGRTEGPLEEARVLADIASGALGESSYAALDGAPGWQPLTAHPPFAAALAARVRPAERAIDGRPLAPSSGGDPRASASQAARVSKPKRRWLIGGGCGALAMLSLCCVGAVASSVERVHGPERLEVTIESAEIELVERDGAAGQVEQVRVVVRTEPGAHVTGNYQDERQADAQGRAVLAVDVGRETEPEATVVVRAARHGDGDRAYADGSATTRVERPARLVLREGRLFCSTRPCVLRVGFEGELSVDGTTPTTRVTLGTSTAMGRAPDPSDEILRPLVPAQLFGDAPYTLPLPVRIEVDGTRFEGTHVMTGLTIRHYVFERFQTITRGPVRVPTEGTGNAILWLGGADGVLQPRTMRLIGTATTAGDIGRVALVERQSQRRDCGTYAGASGTRTLHIQRFHSRITLYDRRSGQVLATHTVSAPPLGCPRNVTVERGAGDIYWGSTEATADDVEAWLRRQ